MLTSFLMDNKLIQEHLYHVESLSAGLNNTGNKIIHGDNKNILPLLQAEYSNKIKCIYIDPPYNNGELYSHYNDNTDHQSWLKSIQTTLSLLKPLLSKDGSIWISIDDNEMHYLKVAADAVFGRHNFVTTIVWQQRTTRENRSVFSKNHEYILVYACDQKAFKASRNLLPLTSEVLERYKNPDNDPRGPWQSISSNVQAGHATAGQFYDIISPNGKIHTPPNGRCWVYNKQRMLKEIADNNIWFGVKGEAVPRIKKFLQGSTTGLTPETLWMGNDVGTNKSAKKHLLSLFPTKTVFDTPKPEQLVKRILDISTNPGDIILDCFLGSGSTISTAHKMDRKYIGVEIGNHITELVIGRMNKVLSGEQGGVSQDVVWKGGGGFDFYSTEGVTNSQKHKKSVYIDSTSITALEAV